MSESHLSRARSSVVEQSLLRAAYLWMAYALFVTGVTAVVGSPVVRTMGFGVMLVLMLGTFGLGWFLQTNIMNMRTGTALTAFTGYAALMGLMLAPIFNVYLKSSIYSAFFICAGTFVTMSIYGFLTKSNLQGMGHYLFMGLIGIMIASLVGFFLRSSGFNMLINYAGVALFTIMAAYDAQRIKLLGQQMAGSDERSMTAMAILSALHLYLTFINLFLFILRILGRRE